MGVGKSMKTFISSMTEQVGMGVYGSKIKSTPLGPFRWNDTIQLWENVNNGMLMNNVSFQDMFIMGYETNSGDNGTSLDNGGGGNLTGLWGNLTSLFNLDNTNTTSVYYSNDAGTAITNANNAKYVTISSNITLNYQFNYNSPTGPTFAALRYAKIFAAGNTLQGGVPAPGVTVGLNDQIGFGVRFTATGWTLGNSGYVWIRDTTNGITLYGIPFEFTANNPEPPEEP
jgi:hypothetical protein